MARTSSYYRYQAYRRRKRNGKNTPRWLIALVVLGGLFAIGIGVTAGVGYGVYRSYANDLEDLGTPDEFVDSIPPGGARIYDRNGTLLFEILNDQLGRRIPVPISRISPHVCDQTEGRSYIIDATIAVEDASFCDNPGVNYRGLAAAAWDNLSPFGNSDGFFQGRGGSSITQQLVKNIYFTFEERGQRSYERKLKETIFAFELTRKYDKEQVLDWYLNLIDYGNLYKGIEAASRGYFGASASELTLPQAALLAGIPQSPTANDPVANPDTAVDRRNQVLRRMFDEGMITFEEAVLGALTPLDIIPQRFPVEAPNFVFNVIQPELERIFGEEALRNDGLEVFTTLDLDWQGRAEAILENHISSFEERTNGHNGAFVAIDPNTAEVLVYVGSRDYFNEEIDGQNDNAAALNSPGSSFKPYVYLTSFIELGWGPGTLILDTAYTYQDPSGPFTPCNPGGCSAFAGPITVRDALGNSLNVPAVKTMLYAGVQNVVDQAVQMGVTSLASQVLGPALTTGGGDVTLIEMTHSYTAFPNLGTLKGVESFSGRPLDPVVILRVEDRDGNVLYPTKDDQPLEKPELQEVRVAPAQETYLVTDILVDPNAECLIFGCGGLSIPDGRPLAVKTGTSAPFEQGSECFRRTGDTWTYAYTPQLVVGTWYGNADNSCMRNVSSSTVSWPIVREFMAEYHRDLPVERFERPSGLVPDSVCIASGLRPVSEDEPNCPRTPEDLFAEASLPDQADDWWTLVQVDSRTCSPECQLAGPNTPEQFAEDRFYLTLPGGLSAFEQAQSEEWVEKLENFIGVIGVLGAAPTDVATKDDLPILITSPADAASVSGQVTITGRASSGSFQGYFLAYRQVSPVVGTLTTFATGNEPVVDGTLGVWDTTGLPTGLYTIQLLLLDSELESISIEVQVQLIGEEDAESSTGLPDGDNGGSNRGRNRGRSGP